MTDLPPTPDKDKRNLVRIIIATGWGMTIALLVLIVGTALYLMSQNAPVPTTLEQWAGIALGFLFGTLGKIITDFVTVNA